MSRSDTVRKNWLMALLLLTVILLGIVFALPPLRAVHADASTNDTDDLVTLRDELLADPTSISGNWLRTLNPIVKNVQGDLVWNSTQQQGVLRIHGLPKPKAGQFYQLWLYDAQGSSADGISGGLFAQGAGSKSLFMSVQTATPVREPYKFELKLHNEQDKKGQLLLMIQP